MQVNGMGVSVAKAGCGDCASQELCREQIV